MKLVVHVGSHKTGTSAIQAFCMTSKDELARHGISYPATLLARYPGQHSDLYRLGHQNLAAEMTAFFGGARDLAVQNGCDTVFLSGEDLCVADATNAGRLVAAARPFFDDIRGVLVLRKKNDYLMSQFKYQLAEGPPIDVLSFSRRMRFSPRASLTAWRTVLGETKMGAMSYDRHRKNFIPAFFREVFDVEIAGDFERLAEANMSLDFGSAVFVNDILKPIGPIDRPKLRRAYRDAFGTFRPRPPIEELVSQSLTTAYPDEDWIGPGLDDLALLERDAPTAEPAAFDHARYLGCFETFLHNLRQIAG